MKKLLIIIFLFFLLCFYSFSKSIDNTTDANKNFNSLENELKNLNNNIDNIGSYIDNISKDIDEINTRLKSKIQNIISISAIIIAGASLFFTIFWSIFWSCKLNKKEKNKLFSELIQEYSSETMYIELTQIKCNHKILILS